MKIIATINPEDMDSVAHYLGSKQIPFQTRTQTDASGIELVEFLVKEDVYERACDAIEQLQASANREEELHTRDRCPSCNSPHLDTEMLDETATLTKIAKVYKCQDCGRVFTTPRR